MSTPTQITARAVRNRRLTYISLGLVVVLLALAVGWWMGSSTDDSAKEPVEDAPVSETEPSRSPAPDPSEDFVVHPGQDLHHNRYPVRFTNDVRGAVSAVIHGLEAQSTNDAEVLAQVLSLYHAEEYGPAKVEQDILDHRAQRLRSGRPEGTDFDEEAYPAPTSYHYITALGVWWEEQDPHTIEVLVLAEEEVSDGAALTGQLRYIYGRLMVWDASTRGGDWVVQEVTDPSLTIDFYGGDPEVYELDYPEWTPVVNDDTGETS